jgi:hypothetical protein
VTDPRFGVRLPDDIPPTTLEAEKVSQSTALSVVGWVLIYLALAPPITVILWRLATMPWGGNE